MDILFLGYLTLQADRVAAARCRAKSLPGYSALQRGVTDPANGGKMVLHLQMNHPWGEVLAQAFGVTRWKRLRKAAGDTPTRRQNKRRNELLSS